MQRIDGYTCCGIYYIPAGTYTPQPLPLLNLTTEITLTPTYSRTVLKQHFKNPSITEAISEANYVFPLHTTQTITSFTCHVGEDKVLNGIVQSKPKAKATYDAAVSRGETAGLLSSADSDVWQTKLGNVPAGASIEVVITCVAQLQHDSERDAIRFNLPTYIASRYGAPPQEILNGDVSYSYRVGKLGWGSWTVLRGTDKWVDVDGGMSIKVFVEMDSPIKMVEAPAHATRLSMGTHSASDSSEAFDPKKALLTLSAKTTSLDKDFVVLVKTARSGHPSAVVQRHPTKDTASMMVTLVPKFNMPVARPEVVFICDRSGSMSGNETQLRKALAVFLQSLPVGCKFNICSFGSSHSFLWSKSKTYSEETLKEAQKHVAGFEADMGGTEMFPPVKAAVERRYKDVNLELLLLTDGDIWQRDQLMDYVREQCKGKTVRMFTLGIGNGISHALIDGLATVGGGYSQVVQLEEKLDSKVVRMLRAALGQHVSDYTLELSGSTTTTTSDEDEYDMLGDAEPEKVIISGKKEREPTPEPKKISLFDTSAELDPPPEYESKDTDEARWAHLPPLPKLPAKIQSPNVIPPLFSFSRTNAYVVFTPCPKTFPKVAKLQAKTITGDILELEIPILKIDDGKDVSQLAARSFLQELENGTGYLHEGLLSAEGITKDKQESKWDEIIEREGVRWGEGFEVASKWTSFVAIEDKPGNVVEEEETIKVATDEAEGSERSRFSRRKMSPTGMASNPSSALRPKAYNATNDLADTATGYRRGGSMKKKSIAPSFGFSALTRSAKSAVQNQGGLMGSTGSELMDFDFDSFLQESDQNTYGPGFAYSSPGGITPYDSCLASSEYSTFHGGFSSIKEHGRVGFHPIYLVSSLGSPVYNPTSPGYTPTSPSYHPTSPPSISKSPPYTGFYPPVRSGVQHSVAFPQFSPKSPNYSPASPCYSPTSPVSTPKATPYGEAQGPEIAQTSSSDQKRKRRLADNGDQDDAVSRNANIWKFNNGCTVQPLIFIVSVTSMFGSSSGGYPMNFPSPVNPSPALQYQSAMAAPPFATASYQYRAAPPPPPPPPPPSGSIYMQAQAQSAPPPPRVSGQRGIVLEDYQMQLMMLEQQNKKRLMMSRAENPIMIGGPPPPPPPPPQMLPGFSTGPPPPPPPPPQSLYGMASPRPPSLCAGQLPPPHGLLGGVTSGGPSPSVYEDLRLPDLDALQSDGDTIMSGPLTNTMAHIAPPPPARESSIAASYVPPPIRAAAAPGLGKPQIPMPSSSFYAPPHKSQDNDEEENLEAEIDTQLAQIGNEVFRLSYLAHSIDQEVEKQNRSIDRYDDKIAKLLDESEHCGTDKRQIVYSASRQKSSAPMPPGGSAMYESPKELKKERSASSSIMKKSAKSFARRSASPGFAKASAPAPQSLSGDMGDEEDDEDMGCDFLEESRSSVRAGTPVAVGTAEERIHGLIMLQSFAGSFSTSDKLASIVAASFKGAPASDVLKKLKELAQTLGVKEEIVATWAAILVFEKGEGHAAERDTWELVVEKAVMWVEGEGSGDDVKEKVRDVIGA
ncbi:hypothetical protein AOL_s00007g107 [Orbilia oligospora ATCC 24927]|uniref:VWFA domain-containing protein n=1 Tax=Arthrobotrys oligospora (strain ATCC 24927 / CBS 115.81 / DSM 1491) TaxID=756982 RepID=G1X1E8_ARTOA|nr:hypothetical protein AOL_s00007g107 [Orbilia oligospora ATCC 24927]EGX52771.1 hypothetical protein AOL_s00007g107 [Orbilia oligospora ATCC 24927]